MFRIPNFLSRCLFGVLVFCFQAVLDTLERVGVFWVQGQGLVEERYGLLTTGAII